MLVSHNTDDLIKRIQKRTEGVAPRSPILKEAFIRIALLVTGRIKLNVTRQHLVDTGNLRRRIGWNFIKQDKMQGIRVGSFGTPYAAVHEFGFRGTVTVSPHNRKITQAFGRAIDAKTVSVMGHSRKMNIRERPFLRPAVEASRSYIVDTLRAAIQANKKR